MDLQSSHHKPWANALFLIFQVSSLLAKVEKEQAKKLGKSKARLQLMPPFALLNFVWAVQASSRRCYICEKSFCPLRTQMWIAANHLPLRESRFQWFLRNCSHDESRLNKMSEAVEGDAPPPKEAERHVDVSVPEGFCQAAQDDDEDGFSFAVSTKKQKGKGKKVAPRTRDAAKPSGTTNQPATATAAAKECLVAGESHSSKEDAATPARRQHKLELKSGRTMRLSFGALLPRCICVPCRTVMIRTKLIDVDGESCGAADRRVWCPSADEVLSEILPTVERQRIDFDRFGDDLCERHDLLLICSKRVFDESLRVRLMKLLKMRPKHFSYAISSDTGRLFLHLMIPCDEARPLQLEGEDEEEEGDEEETSDGQSSSTAQRNKNIETAALAFECVLPTMKDCPRAVSPRLPSAVEWVAEHEPYSSRLYTAIAAVVLRYEPSYWINKGSNRRVITALAKLIKVGEENQLDPCALRRLEAVRTKLSSLPRYLL